MGRVPSASQPSTLSTPPSDPAGRGVPETEVLLVVVWSPADPGRVGESLKVPAGRVSVFGRGGPVDGDPRQRLVLARRRARSVRTAPLFDNPFISKAQLEVRLEPGAVHLANLGKCPLVLDGRQVETAVVVPGRCFELLNQLVFLCVERSTNVPDLHGIDPDTRFAFGEPDPCGLVGESHAIWALREQLSFVAARDAHVLLLGQSGTGKELVARAVHELSARRGRRLVARNAATIPSTLIDAELFGTARNYPNAGMPEREGLFGEADRGTLFLDEIGELPAELQTHLLRVLDEGGEYQRLGDPASRTSDVRLIGATNRPLGTLRADLEARFPIRVVVPGLEERREDIMLLAAHLLRRTAAEDPEIGRRFLAGWNGKSGWPRVTSALATALTTRGYGTHLRELQTLLWDAMEASSGDTLDRGSALAAASESGSFARRASPEAIGRDELLAVLERTGWVRERAWRELGLANRHVLKRLLRKHGLADHED